MRQEHDFRRVHYRRVSIKLHKIIASTWRLTTAMSKPKNIYRVSFLSHEKVYEVYANSVTPDEMFGFVELEDIVFGETSSVVIDPAEEKLKNEFLDVKRTYIPLHNVLRIDVVEKHGVAKITTINGVKTGVSNIRPIYAKSDNDTQS